MRLDWDFGGGRNGFRYWDDLFRFDDAPEAARGWHAEPRGNGALGLRLGGAPADGDGTSGGWRKAFTLDDDQAVTVTFRYKIRQSADYERGEYSEVRLAIDGEDTGRVGRLRGNGDGGDVRSTGWQEVTIDLGLLDSGRHELDLGGLVKARPSRGEITRFFFDDVRLEGEPVAKGFGAFEAEVVALTNDFRKEHGLDPLVNDQRLNAAAEDWSEQMAERDIFRHSDTPALVERQDYAWGALGENIAAGQTTPEQVVEGWIGSRGHRANLLSEDFREIGVGYQFRDDDGGDAAFGHYWTQVFGTELI